MSDKKKRKLITEDDLYAGQAPKDLAMAFRRVGPRPSLLIGHALGLLDKKPSKKKTRFEDVDVMKLAVRKEKGGSVKRMNNGGAVMKGRGGKFKGIS